MLPTRNITLNTSPLLASSQSRVRSACVTCQHVSNFHYWPPLSQFPPNTGHCMATPRCCTRVAAVTISATQDQPMSLQQSLLKPHADRQPRGAAFKLVVADAVNWPQDCATIHHNDRQSIHCSQPTFNVWQYTQTKKVFFLREIQFYHLVTSLYDSLACN